MQIMPSVLEEVAVEQSNAYTPFVDASGITVVPPSPSSKPLKSIGDVQSLLQQGRKQDVKHLLRNNAWPVDSPIRGQLWSLLCIQHQNKSNSMSDGFYWDMVNQVFGSTELPDKPISLPPFVEPSHCQLYYLTHRGRSVADRVVSVLGYACPDIVYSPTIYPICALLLHYMSEEQCYHCMASLVASKEKTFITQTKLLYEVTWKTVMQICKKHVKGAAVHLQRHCNSSRAERIYMDWIWWIFQGLPFQHLVRVMDCFFHEGIKVLYRTAMAILILFHKSSSSPSSEWLMEIQKNGIDSALNKFCKEMPVTPQKVLKVAFGIRGLSSAYISRVFIRTEMVLKSKNVINGSRQLVRSRSSENLPNSQSQNNIQMVSHTLTIREGAHSPGPRTLSMGIYPIQNINSRILDHQDLSMDGKKKRKGKTLLLTLWSWLPVRITMYQPILLYTTEEHGCSLTTFYVRVEHHEPTLLMIKTCNNEVFGAYCSSRWGERNQKDDRGNRQAYFGTGETFLFSLYPERAKYQWVGIEGDKVGHGAELFMAADSKMITIGGGEGQAIWMDENIRFGKTDRCQTFNNPPLCPSGDFEIRVLEVYGFATDQMS
ncbi:GTPase-activating protein skywalker isoform X2 [Tribolium castaneum]|uniref:GTPase-activating protein skywalker isoform X2 n=1 Tax=Tribolium castaneum TaxID=7070 RepID=UPI00077DCE98|nr:PREDICTED: TBC1 domain family member 24 isoform X2 [Tribolium castaneum]|eukprot:XP_015835478.1 PREDICTED: TBC1 domain family member 24 isoform X2 [Tribolium castaneum]